MKYIPKYYQEEAIQYLVNHKVAQLWVGLGLGKTAAVLEAYRRLGGGVMLVVAPLRVAKLTWPNEAAKWEEFKDIKVHYLPSDWSLLDKVKCNTVFTINYEQLPNLAKRMVDANGIPRGFHIIVYDEVTKCKGYKGIRSRTGSCRVREWCKATDHNYCVRWSLTGTPLPNSYEEIWGQVAVLDRGARLGRSFNQFRTAYFTGDYMGWNYTMNPGADKFIQERIKDITLVLKASDHLKLPDTVLEDISVELPKEAREVYDTLERELIVSVPPGKEILAANSAVLVGKLLQCSSGRIYDEDREPQFVHRAKLDALVKLCKSMPKENCIIFCGYKHEYPVILEALGESAEVFGDYDLDTTVERWNKGMIRYLIAHPASAGHGLNLQEGGRTIIWFTLPWSRELYDQANARLCRLGQVGQPLIYRLLCSDTVDEAVAETLRQRGNTQSELLDIIRNLQKMRI